MLCPKCGKELKDGSKFCQFCGSKIEAAPVVIPEEHVVVTPPAAEKKSGSGAKIGLLIAAVAAVLLLALNAVQYFNLIDLGAPHVKDLEAQLASAEADLEDLEAELEESQKKSDAMSSAMGDMQMENNKLNQTIGAMEGNVAELEALIEELEDEIWVLENDATANVVVQDNYETIVDALSTGTLGRASDKFRVDKGYVVLKESASPINVTLTADFDENVTVTTNRTGSAAEMSFNESTWNGDTTTLKVTPNHPGVATVKFTNSVDSQTFTVLIIVTE